MEEVSRTVIRVALKGLAGRKLRASLTAFAIILGVAMMSGTFVLTDTIDKAFSQIFDESYAGTDVVVSGQGADISLDGSSSTAPPVDEALVEEVLAVEGVEAATGIVADEFNTKIIDSDGKALSTEGAPSFGFGFDVTPETERFNPLNIVEGTWADADGEVVLDAGTADEEGFRGRRDGPNLDPRACAGLRSRRNRQVRRGQLARHCDVRSLRPPVGTGAPAPGRPGRRDLGCGPGRHDARATHLVYPARFARRRAGPFSDR